MQSSTCPVCEGKWGGSCKTSGGTFEGKTFFCDVCGVFRATGSVLNDVLLRTTRKFTEVKRAALSHYIRINQGDQDQTPFISNDWLDVFIDRAVLPIPSQQASNIIKFIGDEVSATGVPIESLPVSFFARVGSPNPRFAFSLASELVNQSLITGIVSDAMGFDGQIVEASLSLAGWQSYEAEKSGSLSGKYGFIAMKFNDPTLEQFVKDTVKPAVAEMNYNLVDVRDVARSGIIDNIMRDQIRDSAFVIVDLTHDNAGAYWEAGFAEGLGKPVLYICEQEKFSQHKTHFDTNHCTTVTWGGPKTEEQFKREFLATLRNSLRILPTR